MKTVLFVCVHNAGRSQMAEAFVNAAGSAALHAETAGTLGAGSLNPMAVAVMEELGITMVHHIAKQLTSGMVKRADIVVSMGCGVDADACPAKFLVTEDWGLDDPAGQSIERVREIRDQIQAKVHGLLDRVGS